LLLYGWPRETVLHQRGFTWCNSVAPETPAAEILRGRDGIDVLNRTNAALKSQSLNDMPHFSRLVARV
jgi:hypothetical protein